MDYKEFLSKCGKKGGAAARGLKKIRGGKEYYAKLGRKSARLKKLREKNKGKMGGK